MKSRLREMRKLKGLSQEELAKTSKVSRTTIGQLENNEEYIVTNKTLEKIANALDLRVSDIFFRD